ncbi:MAG: glycosyltransferase [Terriglobales bacterium]
MSADLQAPILLVAAEIDAQAADGAAVYAWELARALGATALSLSPGAAPRGESGARVLARQAGESEWQAWLRALDEVQPRLVLVLSLGRLAPDALLELRERDIRYALFLHDYSQICPTHRLWHRRQEICSGPGPGGLKCAWCMTGAGRLAEFPARWAGARHYPHHWQVAMAGAEALIVPSRSLRDAWISHHAPPERLVVAPPLLPVLPAAEEPAPAGQRSRSLVYAGGWDEAEGAKLLAEALEALGDPIVVEALGPLDAAAQAALRAAVPARHPLRFAGRRAPAAVLAGAGAAVIPVRWQQSYGRLIDEAQRAGAPPVATALGGIPERIIHGLNGFLADPDDAGALAEAIETALRPPADLPGWDASAARHQVEEGAAASLAKLQRLIALLLADAPHAAARAEFERPLAAARAELGLDEEAAYGYLRSALEGRAETSEPAELAFNQIAAAATRARRVHLNHALACYHAAGVRAILCLGDSFGDAAAWFGAWGLDARAEPSRSPLAAIARRLGARAATPDFEPEAIFLERGVSADLDELRRRYPRAAAVLANTAEGVQVL